jgi:hypothetical protein
MKKILLALFFSCVAWAAQAQIILVSDDTVYTSGPATEFEIVAYANVRNTSESAATFRWVKTFTQMPTGWASTICDINFCYPDATDSAEFTLNGLAVGNVDGHFYPNGIVGDGILKVRVYEVGNPTNGVNITFIGATNAASASQLSKPSLKVYPVPADHQLTIEMPEDFANAHIEVYNMIGKRVAIFNAGGIKSRISIGHLPKGQYIIRMNNGKQVLTKYFTKN